VALRCRGSTESRLLDDSQPDDSSHAGEMTMVVSMCESVLQDLEVRSGLFYRACTP
jgi:hypothetical protein